MNYLARTRERLQKKILRFPIVRYFRAPAIRSQSVSMLQDSTLARSAVHAVDEHWRARIAEVMACPDNDFIPRVADAGVLKDNIMTMHNGIRVYALSYYGAGILNMLIENKGVHEPQEERAFMEVLRHLPAHSTMLELGSYWAFYSLWFLAAHKDGTCYMVEPEGPNLEAGKLNFELNGRKGHFEQAYVGDADKTPLTNLKTISVDGFCARQGIQHLHVLHADIQSKEMKMLRGAEGMLSRGAVDYIFISTHTNGLHRGCLEILKGHHYVILASADLDDTYSSDGLIVAKRASLGTGPMKVEISHKRV